MSTSVRVIHVRKEQHALTTTVVMSANVPMVIRKVNRMVVVSTLTNVTRNPMLVELTQNALTPRVHIGARVLMDSRATGNYFAKVNT